MRVLTDRSIQKLNSTTTGLQFFQQEHLVNVISCQPIRRRNDNTINLPGSGSISQLVQARTVEAGATITIIAKDMLLLQLPSLLLDIVHQAFQLLFDGLIQNLPLS